MNISISSISLIIGVGVLAIAGQIAAQPAPTAPALAITQPPATCPPLPSHEDIARARLQRAGELVEAPPVPCFPVAITGEGFGTPGRGVSLQLGYRLPGGP